MTPTPKKKTQPKPPFGGAAPKPDAIGAPDSLDQPDAPDPAEEAADPPPDDAGTTGDLVGAMTQPLMDAGLSDADAKTMLASQFEAALKSLKGGSPDAGAMPMDAGGSMPGDGAPYGR